MSKTYAVILPTAGQSLRFAHNTSLTTADKKSFVTLAGQAVWLHSVRLFAERPEVRQLLVVISPEDRPFVTDQFRAEIETYGLELVDGGRERVDSVQNALRQVRNELDMIAVHDAARPCVTARQITDVFKAAERTGAAMLASPIVGTIKRGQSGNGEHSIVETVPRDNLWEAQTPQVFDRQLLLEAYAHRDDFMPTDDAQLVERLGRAITLVPCDRTNLKITTQADLDLAETILVNNSRNGA